MRRILSALLLAAYGSSNFTLGGKASITGTFSATGNSTFGSGRARHNGHQFDEHIRQSL